MRRRNKPAPSNLLATVGACATALVLGVGGLVVGEFPGSSTRAGRGAFPSRASGLSNGPTAVANGTGRSHPLLDALREREPSAPTFSLGALSAAAVADELVDPARSLPRAFAYPFDDLAALTRFEETCAPPAQGAPGYAPRDARLDKMRRWARYACGIETSLEAGFLSSPPFVHPAGRSYAALLSSLRARPRPPWFDPNRLVRYFHVAELSHTHFDRSSLPTEAIAATLTLSTLAAVREGSEIIPAGARVLIATNGFADAVERASSAVGDYEVYSRVAFEEAMRATEGRSVGLYALSAALALSGGLGLVATGVGSSLAARKAKRDTARRREFALRMLAHELRTPAAGLKLAVGDLEASFDVLPPSAQEALLRAQGAEARLDNVLRASVRYLSSGVASAPWASEPEDAQGLREVLHGLVADFDEPDAPVSFRYEGPSGFRAGQDGFWLSFCV